MSASPSDEPPAPRAPAAFRLESAPAREAERAPAALDAAAVDLSEADVFAADDGAPPPLPVARRRGAKLGAVFAAAFGLLVSLALGLWADGVVRALFERAPWLGWVGLAAAALAAIALLLLVGREAIALRRLASAERLRERAADALRRDDARLARLVLADVAVLLAAKPATAAGRQAVAALDGEVIDGAGLLKLGEVELLAPLDRAARTLVLDAAKRVSLVTAVSPRAFFDVAYVLFEAARLVRRMAELYGGRPGFLGFLRLARDTLAHLAVTGTIAAGDSVVQQLVGHGLAARLSAKLGEGVINGMMTARIGVAAMEAARPLPFAALKRPGVSDFAGALASFAAREPATDGREGSAARPRA